MRANEIQKKQLTMRVRLEFIDDLLGTASGDPDIHGTYVAGKINDAKKAKEVIASLSEEERDRRVQEEVEAVKRLDVDSELQKGKTVFPRNANGEPILWAYQIKGFFKSACSACQKIPGSASSGVKAYKKKIDLGVFVFPDVDDITGREIVIHTDKPIGDCQRPLRAQTPQGERVAISDSESIAKGAWIEFYITSLAGEKDREIIEEWLDYGRYNGIGGWRNSSKGSFLWDYVDEDEAES